MTITFHCYPSSIYYSDFEESSSCPILPPLIIFFYLRSVSGHGEFCSSSLFACKVSAPDYHKRLRKLKSTPLSPPIRPLRSCSILPVHKVFPLPLLHELSVAAKSHSTHLPLLMAQFPNIIHPVSLC